MKKNDPDILKINKISIPRSKRVQLNLPAGSLFDYTEVGIPVEVLRGSKPGPTIFISAAIHGDEINGVEVVRRLSKKLNYKNISGTVFLIPVVNVFGFNNKSRYLPDRRDLNRCFPGSKSGSLAGQMASTFMHEVVRHCQYGIDIHTGAIHRSNMPQIRAKIDDEETKKLIQVFGAPIAVHSNLRDGSLREAARKKGVKTLLFEGGEALRFDEQAIKLCTKGCLAIMSEIGILSKKTKVKSEKCFFAYSSYWERAPHSGIISFRKKLGDKVTEGELLATVSDLFGSNSHEIVSNLPGVIIGKTQIPLIKKGDAVLHIATLDELKGYKNQVFEELT